MNWILAVLIVIAAFFFMEFMAWFTHKYVMHGFLWVLHKDHHIRDGRKIEWNDVFALIFSVPSIILIYFGYADFDYRFWIGIGILAYGIAYFMFHDVYVHQRVKMLKNFSNRYLRATVKPTSSITILMHITTTGFSSPRSSITWRNLRKSKAIRCRSRGYVYLSAH